MSRPTNRMLREQGWKQDPHLSSGWHKNGAYYGKSINAVGQFEHHREPVPRLQMHLEHDLPATVVMHMINAFAAARDVIEGKA